ncbi:MAG: LAGLIDADG family homing endonuclease [Candidatus Aenigmarchaeota archaeon]|nr:LAGLIDADG family homing endonuclease [Candidatus Aenigmarchaeota archaeon]
MLKIINTPKKNEKLAEFVGIMLGDGNIYSSKKYGIYRIKITGNSITDKEYLLEFVKPLIEDLFNSKVSFGFEKDRLGLNLRLASFNLLNFLLTIGLIPGDKIQNKITIPRWIKQNNEYLIACIRGLIDTDGTVFEQARGSGRWSIGFKNNNRILLEDVREALISLGFHPTNITINAIFICRQEEINLFLKRISFNNLKHKLKLVALN